MNYVKSTVPSNVDVHWLSFTRDDLVKALTTLSGHTIPDGVFIVFNEDDSSMDLEWHTPKVK